MPNHKSAVAPPQKAPTKQSYTATEFALSFMAAKYLDDDCASTIANPNMKDPGERAATRFINEFQERVTSLIQDIATAHLLVDDIEKTEVQDRRRWMYMCMASYRLVEEPLVEGRKEYECKITKRRDGSVRRCNFVFRSGAFNPRKHVNVSVNLTRTLIDISNQVMFWCSLDDRLEVAAYDLGEKYKADALSIEFLSATPEFQKWVAEVDACELLLRRVFKTRSLSCVYELILICAPLRVLRRCRKCRGVITRRSTRPPNRRCRRQPKPKRGLRCRFRYLSGMSTCTSSTMLMQRS